MFNELKELKEPIKVGVSGAAGCMGGALCSLLPKIPGMKLTVAFDLNVGGIRKFVKDTSVVITNDLYSYLNRSRIDVLVEATNSTFWGAVYTEKALKEKIHVVLMNSETDLFLGYYLHDIAKQNDVIVTCDPGDQYGVIAEMIEQIRMMGLELKMLGNVKGFLNRYAHYQLMKPFAEQHHLNIEQCVGYTDGSKLCTEMSLLANAFSAPPLMRGMEGPKLKHVNEVIDRFDFGYKGCAVEYILGAKPGGGVFIIAETHDKLQQQYLDYYKMGLGPRYLFYRPYHLCHLETPRAIVSVFLFKKKVMAPQGKLTDVYAFAKRDIPQDFPIRHAIGSDEFYGLLDLRDNATELVPIALLENEGSERPVLKQALSKDQPLKWYDVDIPDSDLWKLYQKQEKLLEEGE